MKNIIRLEKPVRLPAFAEESVFSCTIMAVATTSYLQGVARMKESVFIIVLRQIFLLVPLAWVLHFFGLNAVWWTFPLTEIIASLWGVILVTLKDKTTTETILQKNTAAI